MKENRHYRFIISFIVLVIASFFLFYNLGHYALWDDEATTALFGQSVWRTGDTHAIIDHNIIAYNSGVELRNLHNRYIPPLSFYLVSPFVGLFPGSAFAARFPFALCGLLTIILMLRWLWRSNASLQTWVLTSFGILGNVSLMLYSRQCRYYAPAILITTLLGYWYFYRDNRKRTTILFSLVSLLLLASNYMFYVAVLSAMAVDYFVWRKKTHPILVSNFLVFLGFQLLIGGVLTSIYNLLGNHFSKSYSLMPWIGDKINLLFWNFRELNNCEYGVGILIFLAPFLYFIKRDNRLLECFLAFFVFVLVITLLSPKPFYGYNTATVRYLVVSIPLCIFISVLSIQALSFRMQWLAIFIAILAFGTNVLNGGPFSGVDKKARFSSVISQGRFRSTVYEFTKELIDPIPSAYYQVSDWINQNVNEKESIWVLPNFATYSLMYHAPKAIYAWQIDEKNEQFSELPEIHIKEKIPPEYIIGFGPYIVQVKSMLEDMEEKNVYYSMIHQFDIYWYDLIRPELFWHSFKEVRNFSTKTQGIYVFRRK